MKKKKIISIIFVFILLILDIISKKIISISIPLNDSIKVIPNFFSITNVNNYGIAWSMLNGYRYLIIIITIIIILAIIIYLHKNNNMLKYETISYLMIIGGSLGNLYDRIIHGYVIDFLDFNILGYNYPVFNLADSYIVIGIIILIISMWRDSNDRNKSRGRRTN